MRAAGHGIVMQADFKVVLLQLAVEVGRVAARIEQEPGGLDLASPHHLQQRGGFGRFIPIGIMGDEPHAFERARPVIKHGQQQPLLPREMKDAAEDKLAQFVADGFEEDLPAIRRGGHPVPLPIEHQSVFGFQHPFVDYCRAVGRRLGILQHAHALLDMDNRED